MGREWDGLNPTHISRGGVPLAEGEVLRGLGGNIFSFHNYVAAGLNVLIEEE